MLICPLALCFSCPGLHSAVGGKYETFITGKRYEWTFWMKFWMNALYFFFVFGFPVFHTGIRFMTIFVTYFAIFTTGCHQMLVPVGISCRSDGTKGVMGYFPLKFWLTYKQNLFHQNTLYNWLSPPTFSDLPSALSLVFSEKNASSNLLRYFTMLSAKVWELLSRHWHLCQFWASRPVFFLSTTYCLNFWQGFIDWMSDEFLPFFFYLS